MSELKWKSYGDTGLTALGDNGTWRVVTDGAWWFLSFRPPFTRGMLNRGKFEDRLDACTHAQDREDGVEIVAQGEAELSDPVVIDPLSREASQARIEANIDDQVHSKYSENFRKSLAYYVGAGISYNHEKRDAWREQVFDIVDLALLGIEQSTTHDLVAKGAVTVPCSDPNCSGLPDATCPSCGRRRHDWTTPKCYLC